MCMAFTAALFGAITMALYKAIILFGRILKKKFGIEIFTFETNEEYEIKQDGRDLFIWLTVLVFCLLGLYTVGK
jgi:hypothetical protein